MKENNNLNLVTLVMPAEAGIKDFFYAVSELKQKHDKLVISFPEELVAKNYQKATLFSKKYNLVTNFKDFLTYVESNGTYPVLLQLKEEDRKLLFEFAEKSNLVFYMFVPQPKKKYTFYPYLYGNLEKETRKYLESLSIFDTKRYDIISNTNYPEKVRIKELYRFRA